MNIYRKNRGEGLDAHEAVRAASSNSVARQDLAVAHANTEIYILAQSVTR